MAENMDNSIEARNRSTAEQADIANIASAAPPTYPDVPADPPGPTFDQRQLSLATAEPPVVRIQPSRGWIALQLRELWFYRELLYFLIWRDVKVRYKQTLLGAAWAIIQPFFTMVVFSIFFGLLARVPSEGIPYPIFAYSALVPWMFFANAVVQASNSLVDQERMITKVYFPRLIIP